MSSQLSATTNSDTHSHSTASVSEENLEKMLQSITNLLSNCDLLDESQVDDIISYIYKTITGDEYSSDDDTDDTDSESENKEKEFERMKEKERERLKEKERDNKLREQQSKLQEHKPKQEASKNVTNDTSTFVTSATTSQHKMLDCVSIGNGQQTRVCMFANYASQKKVDVEKLRALVCKNLNVKSALKNNDLYLGGNFTTQQILTAMKKL